VTAANAFESSWGTYCSPDDAVNGVEINSSFGDFFLVNWMEDSEKANIS
jgi:legumain